MPTFTYTDKCTGNGECVNICPSGIRALDPVTNKAYTVEPSFCWECYSCVKACPENAIDVRGYADFAPLNHQVTVHRDTKEQNVRWKIVYRNGLMTKEFEFPIRTTEWDSIKLPDGMDTENSSSIDSEQLSNENSVPVTLKGIATPGKETIRR